MILQQPHFHIAFYRRIIIHPFLTAQNDQILIFTLFIHALPLGLNPVIYPPQYGKDARPGASMALISTMLSLLTLPLFYALLLKLLGALPVI